MSKKPELAWNKRDLSEQTLSSEWVFRASCCTCAATRCGCPIGAETRREYIEHPGAVMVIPLLKTGELVMERQYRYPLRRDVLELPAGKLDPGETALAVRAARAAGRRRANVASRLATSLHHPSRGGVFGREDRDLPRAGADAAGGLARPRRAPGSVYVPLETALEWVREGRITDARP